MSILAQGTRLEPKWFYIHKIQTDPNINIRTYPIILTYTNILTYKHTHEMPSIAYSATLHTQWSDHHMHVVGPDSPAFGNPAHTVVR